MTRYITRDGDVLDAICFQVYGPIPGVTEIVLDFNPGLADEGPIYSAGRVIELPDSMPIAIHHDIRLWD